MTYKLPHKIQQLHHDIEPEQLRYHHKRVAVSKSFTFDAAHHLHQYEGKCKNLHGHTYRLTITVSGYVNAIGMVIDFAELKQLFKEKIEELLDHQYLNEALPPMNTSAENMIVWIWEELDKGLATLDASDQQLQLEELQLFETPTSAAILKRAWMVS